MNSYRCVTLGAALSMTLLAADIKVKVEDLPQAVQMALKQQTQGATVLGASKEKEKGRMTYEVATKLDGKSRDLTFDQSGTLLEVEQEVSMDSVPAAAKKAIVKKAAGGEVKKVESVTHGSEVSYEADVMSSSGKKFEVAVNADGSAHKE